jgi:hypothetical protein
MVGSGRRDVLDPCRGPARFAKRACAKQLNFQALGDSGPAAVQIAFTQRVEAAICARKRVDF